MSEGDDVVDMSSGRTEQRGFRNMYKEMMMMMMKEEEKDGVFQRLASVSRL